MKSHIRPDGIRIFDRDTGMNMLLENHEIKKKPKFNRIPPMISWGLTNRCNLSCDYCYSASGAHPREGQPKDFYSYNDVMEGLKAFDKLGFLEVAFGGGEPLMFPKFGDILINGYRETKLALNFTTNGALFTDDFLKEIKPYVGQIRLSYHKQMTFWESVEMLGRTKSRWGANILLYNNYDEIPEIAKRLKKNGCRDILLLGFKNYGRGKECNVETDVEKTKELINNLKKTIRVCVDTCLSCKLGDVSFLDIRQNPNYCGAGIELVSLTYDGYMKPCSFANEKVYLGKDWNALNNLVKRWYNENMVWFCQ